MEKIREKYFRLRAIYQTSIHSITLFILRITNFQTIKFPQMHECWDFHMSQHGRHEGTPKIWARGHEGTRARQHGRHEGTPKIRARGHEGTPTSMARGHAENLGTRARGHEGTPTSKARGHAEILGTRARGD